MPTNTTVKQLKINKLTEAQYDTAVQGGVIGANELSFLTDVDVDSIQVSSLPTAAASIEGNIYQYIGTTDVNYTNGYFYKCVSDGQTPATYSWTQVNVQPSVSIPCILLDYVVTASTGVITIETNKEPTTKTVKEVVGGATIAGAWTTVDTTHFTFTPTTANDILDNANGFMIKVA